LLGPTGGTVVALWFPTVERILRIHERVLEESGGESGLMRRGSIEAAVVRARDGPFPREDGTLWVRAAFLLRGIAQDHPFVDGNKRTAYETAAVFLENNGVELDPSLDEARDFMISVARAGKSIETIASWLSRNAGTSK